MTALIGLIPLALADRAYASETLHVAQIDLLLIRSDTVAADNLDGTAVLMAFCAS